MPAPPARIQVSHPRRRRQRQQQPMSPHTTRNPTIPTAAQIRMFVIAHLVSVSSFRTPWRPSHTAEPALPPDGADYALFHVKCMLEKQRKREFRPRQFGQPDVRRRMRTATGVTFVPSQYQHPSFCDEISEMARSVAFIPLVA